MNGVFRTSSDLPTHPSAAAGSGDPGRTVPGRPTAAAFHAQHGGGGLVTQLLNQRIGSYLCVPAHRLGLAPTILTGANLVLGIGGSVLLASLAASTRSGAVPIAPVALAALVLWQLAYSFDCADGQLARLTGRANPAGGRVDVLCDAAVQLSLVVAVSIVAIEYCPGLPGWLPSAFGGIWIANLIVPQSFQPGRAEGRLFRNPAAPLAQAAGVIADYSTIIVLFGLILAFTPGHTAALMALFVVAQGLLLVLRIATAAWASLRS